MKKLLIVFVFCLFSNPSFSMSVGETYKCQMLKHVEMLHYENDRIVSYRTEDFSFTLTNEGLVFSDDFVIQNYTMNNIMLNDGSTLKATDLKGKFRPSSFLSFFNSEFKWSNMFDVMSSLVSAKCYK